MKFRVSTAARNELPPIADGRETGGARGHADREEGLPLLSDRAEAGLDFRGESAGENNRQSAAADYGHHGDRGKRLHPWVLACTNQRHA